MKRALVAIVVSCAGLTLTACGSSNSSDDASASSSLAPYTPGDVVNNAVESDAAERSADASASASAAAASAAAATGSIGRSMTNLGVTLTVTSAGPVPSIEMNESNYRAGSPNATFTTKTAPAGAEYYAVTVHITNNAQESMDLTCGYPIRNKLVNSRQQNYDPIDDLYKLQGNPGCNDNLQPGFESDMTYVYEVPAGSAILGWGFADATNLGSSQDYTVVRF